MSSTILGVVTELTWACLEAITYKSTSYSNLFLTKLVFQQVINYVPLDFAPSLLGTIKPLVHPPLHGSKACQWHTSVNGLFIS